MIPSFLKCWDSSKHLAPVVQMLDSAIHWITQLVLLVFIRWIVIYPVESAIHRLNNWGLVDRRENNSAHLKMYCVTPASFCHLHSYPFPCEFSGLVRSSSSVSLYNIHGFGDVLILDPRLVRSTAMISLRKRIFHCGFHVLSKACLVL